MSHTALTMDVEDWFHILESDAAPLPESWDRLESCIERGVSAMLEILDRHRAKATFFWLAWAARKHTALLRRCAAEGHEIASHGSLHLLPHQCGPDAFYHDIAQARTVLEDLSGGPVAGFRAPGFGIRDETAWAFEMIGRAGYRYDASVFPAPRAHGGLRGGQASPFRIHTAAGELLELPAPVVNVLGRPISLFGGGYLRLAPMAMIRRGIRKLRELDRPLIVYVHPRELVSDHPRLPLGAMRRFKCYVNLDSTGPKLDAICRDHAPTTLGRIAQGLSGEALPLFVMQGSGTQQRLLPPQAA